MQAEQDKTRSERTHEEKSKLYIEFEQQRVTLQQSLKRSISKAKYKLKDQFKEDFYFVFYRPYFHAKETAEEELQVNEKKK